MSNILNDDFVDFINALQDCKVEYILVGGYAVIYHGYNRTTGDLDVWVNPTKENYQKLILAFNKFGLSLFDMTEELFLVNKELNVFTFGRPPVCIDLLTRLKGLNFEEVYSNSYQTEFSGVQVRMIDLPDLIRAKIASNRPKDIDDVNHIS